MTQHTDMMGRTILLTGTPERIVSVVPSQTELLYDLGLGERVVGITRFCVHPREWFRSKKRIGGTKQLHIQAILDLQPDLILANKEENTREDIETLASQVPVWISDISTLSEAQQMISSTGALTGTQQQADQLNESISQSFAALSETSPAPRRAAYLIWRNPWMTIGRDTFIHNMLLRCGCTNVYADQNRYPVTSIAELAALQPDIVFLSSEPYPFKKVHIAELQVHLPEARILLVDGEMFSWYGSRLRHAAAYFSSLISGLKQA